MRSAGGGVFSGSATLGPAAHLLSSLPGDEHGQLVPILTYSTPEGCPLQAIAHAVPANASDPDLVAWTKPEFNPILNATMVPRADGGGSGVQFRDPTSAWRGQDGVWRMLVGCSSGACEFTSRDFVRWAFAGLFLRAEPWHQMWECRARAWPPRTPREKHW